MAARLVPEMPLFARPAPSGPRPARGAPSPCRRSDGAGALQAPPRPSPAPALLTALQVLRACLGMP